MFALRQARHLAQPDCYPAPRDMGRVKGELLGKIPDAPPY